MQNERFAGKITLGTGRASGIGLAQKTLPPPISARAARHGATPAQVAIAWTLAQGEHVIPIPGTKKQRYLHDNAVAADLGLTETDLAELDGVPAAVGGRY